MTSPTFQTNADGLNQIAGVRVWKKSDPVYSSGLASSRNEIEWRRVMFDPVAQSSWQALVMGVLSRGWELRPRRETPAAQELQRMGDAIIRGLVGPAPYATPGTGLVPLLWEIPRSLTEGWLPLQKVWKAGHIRYKGRAWPSVERVIAHDQEYFHAALSGELVFQGGGVTAEGQMNPPQVFSGPSAAMEWSAISSRSTRSPYGKPLASKLWSSWYVKGLHVQWRDRTARASITGTPVVHEEAGFAGRPLNDPSGGGESSRVGDIMDAAIQAAIDKASEVFDRYGWIVVPRGWKLDKLSEPGAGDAWQRLIDYHDTRIRLLVEGQELAAEMPSSGVGSYAASKTQEATKLTYVQSLAASCAEWLQDLVASVLRYNVDSDPDDEPLWVFGIQDQVDAERATVFVNLGGKLDGRAIAKRPDWKLPLPPGDEPMILQRSEAAPIEQPPPLPSPFGRLSRASAPAGLAQTWETLTEIEDALAVQRLALARSEYGAHMAAIEAQVLELGGGEIPDPKD